MQPYTSVYSAFCATHAVIPPTPQNAHRALQTLFLRLCPLNHPRYQTDTNGYNTTYDTLEHITATQYLQRIPDTTAAPGRWTGQRSRPIIIRYIRVQGRTCYGYMLTVQHIADHASAAASRCFPRPAACSLAPGQQIGQGGLAPSTRRGSPAAGVRRAARNH